ncbi:hypothetical protein IFR05_008769 [Cadophora sp. M221]|nr:hypothetical protein IFR05_008769 [Cadophora sp. M221]
MPRKLSLKRGCSGMNSQHHLEKIIQERPTISQGFSGNVEVTFMPAPVSSIFHSSLSNASPHCGISDFSEATAFPAPYVNCTSTREDGSVEDIPEADLYRYTRHGWVDIPTPRIIAWSAQKTNSVGAEYILEERARVQPLWTLWQDWDRLPMIARFGIIRQVVEIERKLTDTNFKHCGCIYFEADVPHGERLITTRTTSPSTLERFRMGPLVSMDHWRKEKATMDLNRGPFYGTIDFIRNKAISEKRFLEQHGHPRLNYARSRVEPEQPEEMLELLDKYLKLTPAMVPPPTPDDIDASTLWHPDLHLDNIFIDPKTLQITSIIDWQSSTAAPIFYQCGVPKMVRHREPVSLDLSNWPKLCDNYEDLGGDEKDYAEKMHKSEHLHQYYLRITRRDNPRHWTALQLHDERRVQPIKIVQQVWENNTIFFLRRALMQIAANWENLCPGAGPCPVSFSEEDLALFNREMEKREFVSDTLNLIQKNYGLNPDGTVEPGKYNEIQTEMQRLKGICLEAAENDERFNVERLWPYKDSVDKASLAT